jgi:hypothetical protein
MRTLGVAAVNREELTELHYITPIENVPSLLQHGILSYHLARHVRHIEDLPPINVMPECYYRCYTGPIIGF